MDAHATDTPERVAFYDRIGKENLTRSGRRLRT